MNTPPPIECKVTKWFWWRAGTMFLLLLVLSFWFLRDWKAGYPQKNYERTMYESFQETRDLFETHLAEGGTKQSWASLVAAQALSYPEDKTILPAEHRDETMPSIVADYDAYFELYENQDYKNRKHPPFWKEFTAAQKWNEEPPKAYKDKSKIDEQLYFALATLVAACAVLGVMIWMRKRSMKVDETHFYAPGGKAIPFSSMVKIDKRKWETKGLAILYYQEGTEIQKKRIDGMIYGQFSKAEEEPAERLFEHILARFDGQLIELVEEDALGEEPTKGSES